LAADSDDLAADDARGGVVTRSERLRGGHIAAGGGTIRILRVGVGCGRRTRGRLGAGGGGRIVGSSGTRIAEGGVPKRGVGKRRIAKGRVAKRRIPERRVTERGVAEGRLVPETAERRGGTQGTAKPLGRLAVGVEAAVLEASDELAIGTDINEPPGTV